MPLEVKTIITDMDTGEVKRERRRVIKHWDMEKGYLLWSNKKSVRMFEDIELPQTLTNVEIASLYRLSKHLFHNTNMLYYVSNNSVKAMGVDEVGKVIKLKKRQAYNFLKKMVSCRVIMRGDFTLGESFFTCYYMNPIYFFNSKWLSLNLYLLFKEDLDQMLPGWVKEKFVEEKTSGGR